MKIVNKKDDVSDAWFNEMADKINNMQEGFISNLKSKIDDERSEHPHITSNQSPLGESDELENMLKNVDENTNEFITKLLEGMDEIIKSHDIKQ
jgi:hypothetical protein